jgi:hypothetical protein
MNAIDLVVNGSHNVQSIHNIQSISHSFIRSLEGGFCGTAFGAGVVAFPYALYEANNKIQMADYMKENGRPVGKVKGFFPAISESERPARIAQTKNKASKQHAL